MYTRLPRTWLWGVALACLVLLVGMWDPVGANDDGFRLFLAGVQNQRDGHGAHQNEHPTEIAPGTLAPTQAELVERMAGWGNLPVIIRLNVPAYDPEHDLEAAAGQSAAIGLAQQAVLGRLAGYHVENIKMYEYTPHLAVTLFEPDALAALYADELVLEVAEDTLDVPYLSESVPLIGANHTQFLFAGGAGQSVAILDTGVDRFHPALAGKVISGACYSTNNPAQGASSLCPGGVTNSTALASSGACASFISGCDHGTHVAGIAAGVAPSASIIAIQVFSRITDSGTNTPCADSNRTSPCVLSYTSDQLSALERVRTLHQVSNGINVASANMSLGGGAFTAVCNNDFRRATIQNLRNVHNIVVVTSAGNSGYRNAMGAPACIPEAFSVAASDKNDVIASYSNIANFTNVIAPGSNIFAPIYSPNYQAKNGTSMAAPHIAGAMAVLKGVNPSLSAIIMEARLTNTGIFIADTRAANTGVSKRRISVWEAFCGVANCDSDDFRTLGLGQTLNGNISPSGDQDYYYFFGTAGQRLTLRLNRTSGTLNPFLELYAPNGLRIAFNNSGGTNNNSLINNLFLPQSGRYVIVARGTGTGQYTLNASSQAEPLNPVPRITRLSPSSATATPFGSDFWVAIYGENFMPTSQVRWNGLARSMFYSNPGLIYIRVRGSDISLLPTPPRLAFVSVVNPGPGGGTSNSYPFSVNFPFLGESALLTPATETTIETGVQTSIAISWTAPITATTWRSMQAMDLRIRNENNEVAAWVRIVEQPDQGSFYRLLNAAETQPDADALDEVQEGLPGEARTLVISDTVSLHLEQSEFFGSGLTAIMTPSLTFGPEAVGTWNVEFRVDRKFEDEDEPDEDEELELVQDDDVLGIIHIVPASCPVAVSDVTLDGPSTSSVGQSSSFTAQIAPLNATTPLTYTWVPTPTQGAGTASASYTWSASGTQPVSLFVENCGGFAGAIQEVGISSSPDPDLAIGKQATPSVLPGGVITYTLSVTNTGAVTATNLLITDSVPAGAVHPGGLTTETWSIPELGPFGATAEVVYTVTVPLTATGVIVNSDYQVAAEGGYTAAASNPATTRVVQAARTIDNESGDMLFTGESASSGRVLLEIPAGAVFEPTLVGLEELDAIEALPAELPADLEWLNVAFRLSGFQAEGFVSDLRLSEQITITLRFTTIAAQREEAPGELYRWTGEAWSAEGLECTPTEMIGEQVCIADGAPVGTYVLAADISQLPATYALTVLQTGAGMVETTPDKSLYDENESVTLSAAPDAGYRFINWSGDLSATVNPLVITMTNDITITANFAREYSLSIAVEGSGNIARDPEQAAYLSSEPVTLTAMPEPGWTFTGWSGGATGTENPLTLNLGADTAITATFMQEEPEEEVERILIPNLQRGSQ